jgi:hypothetical protein
MKRKIMKNAFSDLVYKSKESWITYNMRVNMIIAVPTRMVSFQREAA